jgi:hypothetical protein
VGKEPVSFLVVAALLALNTILFLGLGFIAKHLIPKAIVNCQDCPALQTPAFDTAFQSSSVGMRIGAWRFSSFFLGWGR